MQKNELPEIHQELIKILKLSPELERMLLENASSLDDVSHGLYALAKGEQQQQRVMSAFPNLDRESIGIARALNFRRKHEENENATNV